MSGCEEYRCTTLNLQSRGISSRFTRSASCESSTPPAPFQLRGHPFAVTAVAVHESNSTVASGDEGGWVIWWSLRTRRPLVIFRPHTKAVVSLQWASSTKLLTHGRDFKLKMFELDANMDLGMYNVKPPSQLNSGAEYRVPWVTNILDVNSLNFCNASVLGNRLATSSTMDSDKFDVYELDGTVLKRPFKAVGYSKSSDLTDGIKTGIVMALLLLDKDRIIAGYESGHVMIFDLSLPGTLPKAIYVNKCHGQPVLSVALDPKTNSFLSCSADSLIVKHSVTRLTQISVLNTKHSGLNKICVRCDGMIFATAGWDGKVRVFDYKNMLPLAVLKSSEGVTCVDFGDISDKGSFCDSKYSGTPEHYLVVGAKNGRVLLYDIY